MHQVAYLIAMVTPILVTLFLAFMASGQSWKSAEEKAHTRRLADARMDARLLRLNL